MAKHIAAKRWKLGDVTCGHGLVISSFIADRDSALEITSFLGFLGADLGKI